MSYISKLRNKAKKSYQKWKKAEREKTDLFNEAVKWRGEYHSLRHERDLLLEERRKGPWLRHAEIGCDPEGNESSKENAIQFELSSLRVQNSALLARLQQAGVLKPGEQVGLYPPLTEEAKVLFGRLFGVLESVIGPPEGYEGVIPLSAVVERAEKKLPELKAKLSSLSEAEKSSVNGEEEIPPLVVYPDKEGHTKRGQFIASVLYETGAIAKMLIEKNQSYGNSALDPIRLFSKSDAREQIRVRIDDKLSRIQRGKEYPGDNDVNDLIGYLFLYKISLNYTFAD